MYWKPMNRKSLVATALAAALALTAVAATPARAEMNDTTKLILGAVAVGALVTALERKNRREDAARQNSSNYDFRRQDQRRHVLPAACAFEVRTQRGWRDVYGKRCLERAGYRTLPQACAFDVRTDRGRSTVYGERCLREQGYRVEARRR